MYTAFSAAEYLLKGTGMEVGKSFVDCFVIDLTSDILGFLNDPADLIRFSAVSHSCRHFVIANGSCKRLWLRKVPQITSIAFAVQESDGILKLSNIASKNSVNWETLVHEHKIYSSLLRPLSIQLNHPKYIIGHFVGAPSTDPLLEENNILNNFPSLQRRYMGDSYSTRYPRGSSTKGKIDSNVPEYIMHRLKAGICIVTEVNMWLFKAPVKSVCSAKSVRFRIGHPKSIADGEMKVNLVEQPFLDKYEWTYTSPLFPMTESKFSKILADIWYFVTKLLSSPHGISGLAAWLLQQFKLPKPIVCVGGDFLVELFGWTQRDEVDGLFYKEMAWIKILGKSLEPVYNLETLPSGELQLNYYPHCLDFVLPSISLASAREMAVENGVVGGGDG